MSLSKKLRRPCVLFEYLFSFNALLGVYLTHKHNSLSCLCRLSIRANKTTIKIKEIKNPFACICCELFDYLAPFTQHQYHILSHFRAVGICFYYIFVSVYLPLVLLFINCLYFLWIARRYSGVITHMTCLLYIETSNTTIL